MNLKRMLLPVMVVFSLVQPLFSQYGAVRIDLLGLAIRDVRVAKTSLEFAFHKHFSAGISYETGKFASTTRMTNNERAVEIYKATGWGFAPELRYYPFTRQLPAPARFFIGACYGYRSLSEKYTGEDAQLSTVFNPVYTEVNSTGTSVGYGGVLGAKQTFGYITFETLIGVYSQKFVWTNAAQREKIPSDIRNLPPVSVRLEFSLGIVLPKVKGRQVLMENLPAEKTEDLQDGMAKIIIYRPKKFAGFLVTHHLYDQGSFVAEIGNGEYHIYMVKAGIHKFYTKPDLGNCITMNVESGKTYYLRCGVMTYFFSIGQPSFKLMKPGKAQKQLKKIY